MSNAVELNDAVDRLARQVGQWQPARWAAPAKGRAGRPRADVVHELVQRLADRSADAEGEPRRPVPRVGGGLVLPDQLRVVSADLVAAGAPPEVLAAAVDEVTATRRAL